MKIQIKTFKAGRIAGALVLIMSLVLLSCGSDSAGEARVQDGVATAVFSERDDCCTPGEHLECQDGIWCNGEESCDCWGNCEVGPPVNCDDGDPCTIDICVNDRIDPPGSFGEGHCEHRCVVSDVCPCDECVRHSDCDDGDSCTIDECDFGEGLCVYSDRNCNDDNFCTEDSCDIISGCVNDWIDGCCITDGDCNDLLACTLDDCDELTNVCSNDLIAGFCLIDGICYPEGSINPANTCESCQTLVSTTDWSIVAAGTPCEDGNFCTDGETCDMFGNCIGGGDPCVDGIPCTDDTCDEDTDACVYPIQDGMCLIGGVCYNNGDRNPANSCQECRSLSSQDSWTGLPEGTACDDLLFCTLTDTCNAAGLCVGSGSTCDDGVDCTHDTCNEGSDVCNYPVMAGKCMIGGVCYNNGEDNPANVCQECRPATNQLAWTNKPAGTSCDDTLFCNGTNTCNGSGTCVAGTPPCTSSGCITSTCNEATDSCDDTITVGWCYIGTTCYANGDDNPANSCQECRSAVSQTSWTNKASGSACNDGLFCTATDTCNGFGSCVGSGNPCNDGIACTSNNCVEATDSCSYPVIAGYCLIGGICYTNGTTNPANQCQACNTASSQTAWSGKAYGTACSGDAYTCTDDICNGSGTCIHPVKANFCLIGTACYANGANNPINACQWCASATSQTSWTNKPYGAACAGDLYACTSDICNGAGLCIHPVATIPSNDLCQGSALTTAGSGSSRRWTGTGENYCANDDYSSGCGGAGRPDTVHYFDVPIEYDTYRYRIMVGGPANFDSVSYFYGGTAVSPACGQSSTMFGCNNNGAPACWAYGGALARDANDSCWLSREYVFPNGRNYVVVDSGGVGGIYSVKVDRYDSPDISRCNPPQPQIQMGGTWYGTTNDATTDWWTNMPNCIKSPFWDDYYPNIYHINHSTGIWSSLNRGYIINTDGTMTPGGFDTVKFFLVGECTSPWYICSCDDDTYHFRAGQVGRGSQQWTGRIPAGKWAGIFLTSYWRNARGNYKMTVEVDNDGDGLPNASDGSGLMYGARSQTSGGERARNVSYWPYMDSGYSFNHPYNSHSWASNLGWSLPGREVYYTYQYPGGNSWKYIDLFPRVRGDVWSGAASFLWDAGMWVYFPTGGTFCCYTSGWSCWNTSAGTWRACDWYGGGGRETAAFRSWGSGRYYIAVDSYNTVPRGGWYTITMANSPYAFK